MYVACKLHQLCSLYLLSIHRYAPRVFAKKLDAPHNKTTPCIVIVYTDLNEVRDQFCLISKSHISQERDFGTKMFDIEVFMDQIENRSIVEEPTIEFAMTNDSYMRYKQ